MALSYAVLSLTVVRMVPVVLVLPSRLTHPYVHLVSLG